MTLGSDDSPPANAADHAEDFGRRYAEDLDIAAGQVLMDLGIDPYRLARLDPEDFQRKTFFPGERTVDSVSPEGVITVDSGVMNLDVMDAVYGRRSGDLWRRLRLRERIQAAGVHEYEEHEGGSHQESLRRGPVTALPISPRAREMLELMRDGWHGREWPLP